MGWDGRSMSTIIFTGYGSSKILNKERRKSNVRPKDVLLLLSREPAYEEEEEDLINDCHCC